MSFLSRWIATPSPESLRNLAYDWFKGQGIDPLSADFKVFGPEYARTPGASVLLGLGNRSDSGSVVGFVLEVHPHKGVELARILATPRPATRGLEIAESAQLRGISLYDSVLNFDSLL